MGNLLKTISVQLILGMLLFPSITIAEMLIQSVEGKNESVTIYRKGKLVKPIPMTRLQENDFIEVKDPIAHLILVGDDGQPITIDADHSPYSVPVSTPHSWMGNALHQALSWYETVTEKTQAVNTITRGDGKTQFELLGMELGENLLQQGINELHLTWLGGTPPYEIKLIDEEGNSVIKMMEEGKSFTLLDYAFKLGEYQLQITTGNGKSLTIEERSLIVLPASELPESVLALQTKSLSPELKTHLTSILLASETGWRFAALQKAMQIHDKRLVNALLGMH